MTEVRRPSVRDGLLRHVDGFVHASVMIVAVLWIAFAILVLVLRHLVLPHVDDYRPQIERLASRALGETVRIGAIHASLRGLRPSLTLQSLEVVDAKGGETLALPSVEATLSWESLVVMQLRLASLELEGPRLNVRRDAEGQLFVAGFALRKKASPDNAAAEWLLSQNALRVRHATLVWRDAMGDAPGEAAVTRPDLVLTDVSLSLKRSGWSHRLALRATPPSTLAAPLDLRALIAHPFLARRFAEPERWRGTAYVDFASGDVAAWRTWVPLPPTFDSGRGRARVWVDFTDAQSLAGVFAQRVAERTKRPALVALDRIAGVTADLALDDVAVRWGANDHAELASIDGRIDASQTPTEQRFSARRMALEPRDGVHVPPTDFEIHRTVGTSPDDESGKATLGAIDIGVSLGLVPEPLVPPAIVARYTALKPHGLLDRLAFEWTGPAAAPKTFRAEAAFQRVGVAAQPPTAEAIALASREIVGPNGVVRRPHPAFGQPGFDNLGGTLVATRAAGAAPATHVTMQVHGQDATVTAPGLFDEPVLRLAHVAAQVDVTHRGDDLEVRVADGTLDNTDLAATVALTFRHGPGSGGIGEHGGRGWIDLDAHLSRAEVARVPRYLPNLIGPKARAYLVRSLLGGKVTDASFRMLGALERLDLRAMPGAAATTSSFKVADALAGVRDGGPASRALPDAYATATNDGAIFHAVVKVKNATFLYGPARDPNDPAAAAQPAQPSPLPPIPWPAFEDLDADIVFDQARMTVIGHSTRVFGYRLTDVRADLPALADPAHVLRVTGKGNGPLQDLLHFINASPVARWTKQFTATSRARGDAAFSLALDLPLTRPREAEVAGSLLFADDELTLNALVPPFSRLRGRLDFTDRSLTIDGLTGVALGGPLRVDAATREDGWIDIDGHGTIDVAALQASLRDDASAGTPSAAAGLIERVGRRVSGGTNYDVALRIRNRRVGDVANNVPDRSPTTRQEATRDARPDLLLTSDLVGLATSLPAPLAKTAAESWPLRIAITRTADAPGVDGREDIRLSLGKLIDADITRKLDAQGRFAVTGADYGIGEGERAKPGSAEGGPSVRVALPSLDLDAWRDAIRELAGAPRSASADTAPAGAAGLDNLLPVHATLATPLLHAAGRDFTNVAIDAKRLPSGWQGDVVADQVAGRLSYTDVSGAVATRAGVAPVASGRLVARLSRLVIPQSDGTVARTDDAFDANRQRDFPEIDLVADRFELRGRSLGRLEVLARNVQDGATREWQLAKLGLSMPEARFTASGAWGRSAERENTHLDFGIEASDLGALMDRFGLVRTIKNGTARLAGNVAWHGGPTTIDFATLEGRLDLQADNGQFLKADPGIAKLLNILSLQGLARRLTFDFHDVFDAGFAFDTVRADVVVDKGIATTDDFRMRGVQATVTMAGNADLQHETTDLRVRVEPDINAGAAALGVAVVNPVLGLATFAAQYLFKDSISQALAFEYNVVGPWSKPEVTKIDSRGKVTPVVPRKTASGTTPAPSTATAR